MLEPPILSFDEILNFQRFEELVAAYFRLSKKENDVKPPGIGADGGRDILVDIPLTDGVVSFKRRWVVQCKFHSNSISTSEISDINIPTLLHSYKANGYLLICKDRPTSKLTAMFERLNQDCVMKYRYEIWSGDLFKSYLLIAEDALHQNYFPQYYAKLQALKKTQ